MAIRKSVNNLSTAERAQYVNGVKLLKAETRVEGGVTLNRYDDYVRLHNEVMSHMTPGSGSTSDPNRNAAHSGPSFLPWHRQLLLDLERDLQRVLRDPNFGIPYWDWAADAALAPTAMSVWQDDFMGGQGNPVTTGQFRAGQWRTIIDLVPNLVRQFGVAVPTLPTPADVTAALAITIYDQPPFGQGSNPSFRNQLEGWINGPQLHNRVHVWIGGSMGPMSSPNDPVFFLHHSNVDRLWAQWQLCMPGADYRPVSGGPTGHNLNDVMWPWDGTEARVGRTRRRPADVINHLGLGYLYDTEIRRQTVTMRRQSNGRFVSTSPIRVVAPCNTAASPSGTLFVPGRTGGIIRAERNPLTDQVDVAE